jgi:hypothetical protein
MSKRELGKLASVDVDAPRAKRRREAAPQEKKPDPDMDMDATSAAGVKREQEDPAALKQVKEQGLKLWQTVKDEVDKECVTSPAPSCARSLLTLHQPTMIFPVAAHFQSTFFASPTNAPTQTITP